MHEFVKLTIADVRPETPEAVSVAFHVPEALKNTFAFQPGQHLVLRTRLGEEELRRTYSICSGPDDGELRIAIKRIAGGRFSNHANDTLRAGQQVEVLHPAGRFIVPEGDRHPRHLVAFAAGVGITPILAMVKHTLTREPESRFTLIYGNRTPETTLFRSALEDLKDRYVERFTLLNVLSRSGEEDVPVLQGRIDACKVETIARRLLKLDDVAHVFLCGPGSMIKEARDTLMALGFPRARIHHEFFAAGGGAYQTRPVPSPAAQAAAEDAVEVTAILDGLRRRFTMSRSEHVVDAAERAGVHVPYSCKGGMCCTCRCRILEGQADMTVNYSLEPWEVEKGFVLSCQARPTMPRLVLDYDAL
ncbi:MAG: 2Fe-2S iron-sulfur cluster-binding protein [Hyphomicrobiaceae bacterium]